MNNSTMAQEIFKQMFRHFARGDPNVKVNEARHPSPPPRASR